MHARRRSGASKSFAYENRIYLEGPREPPLIRESWRKDSQGVVVEYSLAYIDFTLYPRDNGRVLGYDNAHGFHERHFRGQAEETTYTTYEEQLDRFLSEVHALRNQR